MNKLKLELIELKKELEGLKEDDYYNIARISNRIWKLNIRGVK